MTGSAKMTGTVNQIEWARRLKAGASAEFDRVAKALQSGRKQADARAAIAILEDKRAEVMAHDDAGYFIRDWQELSDQVRRMIAADPRYQAIKTNSKTEANNL